MYHGAKNFKCRHKKENVFNATNFYLIKVFESKYQFKLNP